jgi:hypothetical protein
VCLFHAGSRSARSDFARDRRLTPYFFNEEILPVRIPQFSFTSAAAALVLIAACNSTETRFEVAPANTNVDSGMFVGEKANKGHVTLTRDAEGTTLTLSADFVTPGTPDPHWQIVDAAGNAYLRERLEIKENGMNRTITVPDYVESIASVRIWCAFAEVSLGEAKFARPVVLDHVDALAKATDGKTLRSGPFRGEKANTGFVTETRSGGSEVLTLSDDFQVPGTPDPHWRIVDDRGYRFLLQRLPVKDGKVNRQIKLPAYVGDVKAVQMWCAFAEVKLGEASFEHAAP